MTFKVAGGVTGSGFIVLSATLSAVGHVPVAGLALILGIDRFMSEARALTNIIGNGIATIVVGKWCKELDEKKLHSVLGKSDASIPDMPELPDPKVFRDTQELKYIPIDDYNNR